MQLEDIKKSLRSMSVTELNDLVASIRKSRQENKNVKVDAAPSPRGTNNVQKFKKLAGSLDATQLAALMAELEADK